MGTSIDAWYLLLAAFLAIVGYRGVKSGQFGFSHDEKLAVTRSKEPYWFWGQVMLIFGCVILLVWAAFN